MGERGKFIYFRQTWFVMKVILLSGAHGVGKGYFLDKVKANIQNYEVYSASNLIERYQASTDAGYKKVKNVSNNQDILVKAIKEEMAHNEKDFILDGHLCIFNSNGEVERIPERFLFEAHIVGIVLLQDDPKVISARINQRDSNTICVTEIKIMQEEEKEYAKELQDKFDITYAVVSHECTGEQFEELLRKMGGCSR